MGRARPKDTPAVRSIILERLADGESLRAICEDLAPDGPKESTVRFWVVDDRDGFAAQYARARDVGYDCRAEQAVNDAANADDAPLGRLAFDAERWYLGKMKTQYSDKVALTGADGGAILIKGAIDLSDDELAAIVRTKNVEADK
jgi:hypothetical protein